MESRRRARRPSIHQVAEVAGVAPSTVSRYLNGQLSISSDTEKRIHDAMGQVGYEQRADVTSRAAVSQSKVVALIVPRLDAYFGELAEHLAEWAQRNGLTSIIFTTRNHPFNGGALTDWLEKHAIDGVVFAGLNRRQGGVRRMVATGVPVVAIAEPVPGLDIDTVRVDYHSGAHQAVAYLASMGHTEIALVAGPRWLESNQASLRGFCDAMQLSGLVPRDERTLFGEISREFGYAALSQIMLLKDRPSAVFVTADEIALGVLAAARDLGVAVPADLSVIGSDDISFTQFLNPPLTSVRVPLDRMAERAIDLLLRKLNPATASDEVADVVLPVSLQVRQSVQHIDRATS